MLDIQRIAFEAHMDASEVPTVQDVLNGTAQPEGDVTIIGFRNGRGFKAKAKAEEVEWNRLDPRDRVLGVFRLWQWKRENGL